MRDPDAMTAAQAEDHVATLHSQAKRRWSSPRIILSDLAGTNSGGNQTTDLGTGIFSKSPS
jgi:hypothetical protein